ncbi:MBL fold metallo-hydrolase [Bacillus salipaludis]|uniref:MBL fold metallo-hydrolase n=1 Tax=Bacillus salipaludis TaxID=2547811 RepID=A0A4R5VSH6_9BACI|nr:MBL fold metallo-hydrolase [Bacillus salipaludis]MDQ6599643.1 MBL fold metallo-hydrolase [Bacillus salipaludis]TDK61728.1 MBL fold metallo-hydrolase [Bacillus salipaludis]
MKWSQIPLGVLQTNCYIVENPDQTCLIFDPGSEGKKLINWLTKRELRPVAIFLTHAHFDHIGAVDEVRDFFKIPVYVHEEEEEWLSDPKLNGSKFFMMKESVNARPAEFVLKKEEDINIAGFEFKLFETPGHSPGSVSYYFEHDGFVVSGDALFKGSIGRTDLPKGNQAQLLKSIHEKLLFLPEETVVLPGHGPETTIIEEMDSNPFLNGF